MHITSDFPGGNIVVDGISGDTVRLHQDLRDTEGDWFYWCFRVAGAAGRTVHFEFTGSEAVGARGPAVRVDGDGDWRWLGWQSARHFTYTFPPAAEVVSFCVTMPYVEGDWQRFLGRHEGVAGVRAGVLCKTRQGRAVEMLRIGGGPGELRHRVLITARHHSCETMGSHALEGFLEAVLRDGDEEKLFENIEVIAIPFMDKDGVENGDQGKNRRPRDHNRDYDGESVHRETAALRKLGSQWPAVSAALDLHCPWLFGGLNEKVYLVGSPIPSIWAEQEVFGSILEERCAGPLPFRKGDSLPYGTDWNSESNYQRGKTFTGWASELPGVRLVSAIEVPYANARGAEVNAESARALGAELARAVGVYFSRGG